MEELAAEEACQGRYAATLEAVMEAARPSLHGQLEGLGALARLTIASPWVVGPSWLSTAVMVQLPAAMAT